MFLLVVPTTCSNCVLLESKLSSTDAENAALREQLQEVLKQLSLVSADLDRYQKAFREQKTPNTPERAPTEELQLAFDRILAGAPDTTTAAALSPPAANEEPERKAPPKKRQRQSRQIRLENLPVVVTRVTPEEVKATGGNGWVLLGTETRSRLGYRTACFYRIDVVYETYKRADAEPEAPPQIVEAAAHPALWPYGIADTSVVAGSILKKYDYSLPLNRQQRMSETEGFVLPRSSIADWIGQAHGFAAGIVEAMHCDSRTRSSCIATDATGAPVRIKGGTASWHVFVFIGDVGHVTFRASRRHSSAAIAEMLEGYQGHLLADASAIYDGLYGAGATEVGCWAHVRRYFFRAMPTEPERAYEALFMIRRLFEIDRHVRTLPAERRTLERARLARPLLAAFDAWIARSAPLIDKGGRLSTAFTYYENQRDALRRFLDDARLEIHNNASERQLRNLVLGLRNWKHFETKVGVDWYTTFRSLIVSCKLHDLNTHVYLEQMLRLAPHWPAGKLLSLAPKNWTATVGALDTAQRAIIEPEWTRTRDHAIVAPSLSAA